MFHVKIHASNNWAGKLRKKRYSHENLATLSIR